MNKLADSAQHHANNRVTTFDIIEHLETRHPADVAADFIEIAVGDTKAELDPRTKLEQGIVLAKHLRSVAKFCRDSA